MYLLAKYIYAAKVSKQYTALLYTLANTITFLQTVIKSLAY